MSIKQNGGVFGRNPTFNDLTIEGDLILNGEIFTGLDFQGSWNASTNSPSLASSTGTNGEFYIVSVAGTTNLNGITNWGIGDWAIFNGTVWQRVEGGADGNFDALTANSLTINGADAVGIDDYILHNGDSNTKFGFSGNDAWKIRTGGVDAVTVDGSQNVSIPAGNLTVGGVDVNITGNINHSGDGDTYFGFHGNDLWRVVTGGAERIEVGNSGIRINEGGADMDFTIESSGNANMFVVDGGNNRVGIGTGSPAKTFHVVDTSGGNTTTPLLLQNAGGLNSVVELRLAPTAYPNEIGSVARWSAIRAINSAAGNATDLAFVTNSASTDPVEAMRISSTQNVTIPNGDLTVGTGSAATGLTVENQRVLVQRAGEDTAIAFADNASGTPSSHCWAAGLDISDSNGFSIAYASNGLPSLTGSNVFGIDTSGNVSVPSGSLTVGAGISTSGVTVSAASNIGQVNISKTFSGGTSAVNFRHNNGLVGQIYYDNTSTAYITSSDYRLKEDVQAMSGATDRLKELKPVNFAWKVDGSRVDGFLAHEAQEVVPESVSGAKDAMMTEEYEVSPATGDIYTPEVVAVEGVEAVEYVAPQDEVLDEDGNVVTEAVAEVMAVEAVEAVEGVAEVIVSSDVEQPSELEDGQLWRETTAQVMGEREVPDYQGIDQAKLVPLLVATIQELEARITALES